jgi:hypothetical protein
MRLVGRRQSQHLGGFSPPQLRPFSRRDVGVTPQAPDLHGRFTAADAWPVDCGIQDNANSKIEPFPGITPESRPSSKGGLTRWETAAP